MCEVINLESVEYIFPEKPCPKCGSKVQSLPYTGGYGTLCTVCGHSKTHGFTWEFLRGACVNTQKLPLDNPEK